MNTGESDLQAYDNETRNDTVTEIIMVTEKESETTDPANQAKSVTYSIRQGKPILVEPSKGNRGSIPRAEHHHDNKEYTVYVLEERFSKKNTTHSMPGNPVNCPDGRNLGEKSHTAKDSIETIEDDTGNASNNNSDCVRVLCNTECNSDSGIDDRETVNYPAAVVPIITDDDKDELAATDFAWPVNQPNGRKFVETNGSKEAIDDTYNHVRTEQNCEKLIAPELEIRFGIDDLRIGYDKGEDDIYNFHEITKVVFRITILPQGKGLHSICQLEPEL